MSELIKCETITAQMKIYNKNSVLSVIRMSVEKCAIGLNIKLSDLQVATLCEDIIESYPYESIEDVREVLKNARQGVYGFGYESRGSLTMNNVREWMACHLENKTIEREKEHGNLKNQFNNKIQEVNYELYKMGCVEKDKRGIDFNNKEEEYLRLKSEYLMSKTINK